MNITFVLIHSPLVGPDTWSLAADALRARGHAALVPTLPADVIPGRAYWAQHAEAAARQADQADTDELILVGHSGAGALLPAVREGLGRPVRGYVFVDAGLPAPGQTRLDTFGDEAAKFRAHLAAGGQFPDWTDEDLRPIVPDRAVRERLRAGLRPQPLAYWEEPLPVVPNWPDAPCAYLLFSPVYAEAAAQARASGWLVREMPGGHFHMLVEPAGVAEALAALAQQF